MKKCIYCKMDIPDDATVCGHCGKEQKKKTRIWPWILLIFVGIIAYGILSSPEETATKKVATKGIDYSKVLKFNVVSIKDYGPTMVGVKVKITNLTDKPIHNAQATCILLDANKKEIGFQKHYVIKSTEGGLEPRGSTYFEYVMDGSYDRTEYTSFKVDSLKFR